MTKLDFIALLYEKLSGLPADEVGERIAFYCEMIDDGMEDGLCEEQAVGRIGSVDEIADQIIADVPLVKLAKEKIKQKRHLAAWEIVLLVLGSPIWLSLAIAALAVVLSVYVVLWSVIVSVWAIFVSLGASGICGVATGIIFAIYDSVLIGVATVGAGALCIGLAIFAFFGCRWATKGIILLTKKIALGIKKCFVRKEAAQ